VSGARRVTRISTTPVKGLALLHPEAVELGPDGAADDRRFLLVDEDARLVAGKRLGVLATIGARYDPATERLELRLPGEEPLAGAVELGAHVTADVHGDLRPSREVVGPWSDALSCWAGRPLRLLRPEGAGRGVDRGSAGGVTLLSRASLAALRAAAGADGEVDDRRFRMLFLIEGAQAHEEDAWLGRRVAIGEAVVRVNGNVGRCAVTTQNPATGVPDLDTLQAIAAYRGEQPATERLPFGVWGEVETPGRVRVGDAVAALG
jgi:uncharacterized protein